MEKAWCDERFFFQVLMVIVKHKKSGIKDTMSIKITFYAIT